MNCFARQLMLTPLFQNRRRALASTAALLLLGMSAPATGQEGAEGELRLKVTEMAQSVDLSRGREKFLTVTVEVSGGDAARLRRVQPLREDFQLLAGKRQLPCRWLRGGSLPEDPQRLRFTLGFSMPPAGTKSVTLQANLPRLENADAVELRLTDISPGATPQERKGTSWSASVYRFEEEEYVPPALPPSGRFTSKAGPVDARVYRAPGGNPAPARAFAMRFHSRDAALYDRTVDVSGKMLLDGGGSLPLLSALLKRDPSATVKSPPYPAMVDGTLYFAVPAGKQRPTGVILTLSRRPLRPNAQPLRISNLPVP